MSIHAIGPYKIWTKKHGHKILELWCVTMLDPATGWFKIKQYDDKKSITVSNIVRQEWLARYPRPYLITLDRGSEFIGQDFCDMCINDYGIKRKIISTWTPQAIVEHVHQMLRNLIWRFELQDNPYIDMDDPWSGFVCNALNIPYYPPHDAWPAHIWERYDT